MEVDSTAIEYINLGFLSLCFLVIFPAPLIIFLLLKKRKLEEYIKNFYEIMNAPDHKFLLYMRKMTFGFSITILKEMLFLQIFLLAASSLIVTLHVIIKRPYEVSFVNKKNIISESLFFLMICSLFFIIDSEYLGELTRINISWIPISLFSVIIVEEILIVIKELISQIIQHSQKWKLQKNSQRITPFTSIANSEGNKEDKIKQTENNNENGKDQKLLQSELKKQIHHQIQRSMIQKSSIRDDSHIPFEPSFIGNQEYIKGKNIKQSDSILHSEIPKLTEYEVSIRPIQHHNLLNIDDPGKLNSSPETDRQYFVERNGEKNEIKKTKNNN